MCGPQSLAYFSKWVLVRPEGSSKTMAYPVLLWDDKADEMACTGCMACVNYCPTQCIFATVAPNPRFRRGESTRKTAALSFQINLPKCIECGICVDVCKYDAIALGYGGPAQVAGSGDGFLPLREMESIFRCMASASAEV